MKTCPRRLRRIRELYAVNNVIHRVRMHERREQIKRWGIALLGGACTQCGLTLEDVDGRLEAFDFHHKPGETKAFNIAGSYQFSWRGLDVSC